MGNKNSVPANRPNLQFRVLIIGRANAGKTTILQRVCDTTESPIVYRRRGNRRVKVDLDPSMERGEHSIEDELIFSNHDGYIFHDSCGFEAGSVTERKIVQGFIRQMSTERRLKYRLHAIWYCVPMDNHRPELDLRYLKGICPDKNVPVIAVFTKYDQYLRNIQMHLEDFGNPGDKVSDEADRQFKEHYLRYLGEGARFVRLEKMHRPEARCPELLRETVQALNVNLVALMLLAVQRSDLELNIDMAVKQWSGTSCASTVYYLSFLFSFSSIILICKHATILCFSGSTAQLALTQAESNYQKANIASKIEEHFTLSYQEYSMEQFIGFLMNTNIADLASKAI
ncbi:hypothetical protein V8E53_012675 [Lactarius tabidus]